MKVLVVLSSVLVAALAQPAFLGLGLGGDAPDVAVVKAAHLATQAEEATRNTLGIPNIPAATSAAAAANAARNAIAIQGFGGNPNIVIGPNGVPLVTPEVALSNAARAVAYARTAAQAAANPADPTSSLVLAAALGVGIQGINNANTISRLQLRAALLG